MVDDGGNADLTITHEGGDPIHSDRTRVIVEMVESNGGGDPAGDRDVVEPASTDQVLTAGSTTTYEISNNDWTGAWSARDPATVQGFTDPDPGDVVRLTIVDTETNGIVYEREYEVQ